MRHYPLQGWLSILGLTACVPFASLAQTTLDVSTIVVEPSSFRLGQYSGLHESGSYFSVDVAADKRGTYNDRENRYWRFLGQRLGLPNSAASLNFGAIGHYAVKLDYQRLPHFLFDGPVSTPFSGAGSDQLTLPSSWVADSTTKGFTQLQQSLQDLTLKTDRQHLSVELSLRLADSFTMTGDYQRQVKKGLDPLGAAFGSTGGNARAAVLAAPVDYVTDNFVVKLERQQPSATWSISYRSSLFSNHNAQLQWNNPFNNAQWRVGAGFSAQATGAIALVPDNQSHVVAINRVQAFGSASRLSASISAGRMTQDEALLPYSSVFAADTALPVSTLDGVIRTLNGVVTWSTRFGPRLTLRSRYAFDQRDNDTAIHPFLRIAGDVAQQATIGSDQARLNRPYSHVKQQFSVEAALRLPQSRQLQLEWRTDAKSRDMVDVDRVEEDSVALTLQSPLAGNGRGRVELMRARRRGSPYTGNAGFLAGHTPEYVSTLKGAALYENDPLLRRFHVASRDREQLTMSLALPLPAMVEASFSTTLTDDEFPGTELGLQAATAWNSTLNLDYTPNRRLSVHGWLGRQVFHNRQRGYSRSATTPILPPSARLVGSGWSMSSRDLVDSSGIGMEWQPEATPLQLEFEASYSDAGTRAKPYSSGLAWLPLPTITTRFTTVSVMAAYTFANKHKAGMRLRYDDYHSTDFALDNTVVDSLNNVLLLGNASPVYAGTIIELHFTLLLP